MTDNSRERCAVTREVEGYRWVLGLKTFVTFRTAGGAKIGERCRRRLRGVGGIQPVAQFMDYNTERETITIAIIDCARIALQRINHDGHAPALPSTLRFQQRLKRKIETAVICA